MNEWYATGRPVSHYKGCHVPQVTAQNLHQASAHKMKLKTATATWNIRTLLQKGKSDNIKQEMKKIEKNVLGISQVRWLGPGKIISGKFKMVYSGSTEHERGVAILLGKGMVKTGKGYW